MNDAETGQVLEMDDCEPDSDSENGDYFLLQNFNQPETETAISEEIAKQIELESDKNNLAEELGGEVEKEILQEDAINTNKKEDSKAADGRPLIFKNLQYRKLIFNHFFIKS